MKLSELITTNCIVTDMSCKDKESSIRDLVDVLHKSGRIDKKQMADVVKSLLKREELGSTGIGKGVAVPHAKDQEISETMAVLGRHKTGVEFGSVDGEPVDIFFLIISPVDNQNLHLKLLANISRLVRGNEFCSFLRQTTGAAAIIDLVKEKEGEF